MKRFILVIITFLFFITSIFSQVTIKPIPSWVEDVKFNINPEINLDEVVQGNLLLLYNEQIDVDTQKSYFKIVTKITENVGVQSASSIEVVYDPSYQSITFNSLNVIRDGKVIDKLKTTNFETIRRELSAESYIYDGSLTAFTNVSDVRNGDIVEYSYTIKGFNPIHKGLYSASFNLTTSQPIGKMFVKVKSKKPLRKKLLNTDLKIQQEKINGSTIYKISQENIEGFKYEDATPTWHISSPYVNISNYKSWQQVVDWGCDIFKVNKSVSAELRTEINKIKTNNEKESDRINAALNFVQDEVRYLGLESGIGAYKPFSPNKVFKQRYGDCKDKSLLLVTMLKELGVEAYPVLVNTYLKGTVKELLPAAEHFNHCVVKVIDEYKSEIWYDPTISNQGGDYKNIAFPDYRYGLVLKKGNTDFDEIFPFDDNLTEVTDNFIIEKGGKGASLKIKSVYYKGEADKMRSYFKNNSISSIKKEYEKYYAKYFNNIKGVKNPEYVDDIEDNIFITKEEYKIDSLWKPAINNNQVVAEFYPYTIIDMLSMPTKLDRKSPFALNYPVTRNHKIKVKLPDNWRMHQDSFSINSPNIFYDMDVFYNPNKRLLTIEHSLKTQKDHVSVEEFTSFYKDLQSLDNQMVYSIITPKDGSSTSSNFSILKIFGRLLFFTLVGFFIWIAIKLYKFDPIPKIENYFEENKKIGGWLILIGIGICLSPFKILIDLFSNNLYITGEWLGYFSSTNLDFKLPVALMLILETIVNAFLLVYYPLAIILFFTKRSSFPKIHAYFLIIFCVFNLVDIVVVNEYLPSKGFESQTNEILKVFISTAIIAPYLLISERVKETFVKRLINKKQ